MTDHDHKSIEIVLRTLVYYDIFDYPLLESDILDNCTLHHKDKLNCRIALDYLVKSGVVYKLGDYYSMKSDPNYVEQRIKGNQLAEIWIRKAKRFSWFISGFPYVRAISLSGSLSKGFIGEDPDIDYFIITEPNRLWLTRTMLVAFKKVFLLNSYKYFCVNYFIDTENMEIEDKNLFTATELTTMIPVYGNSVKKEFYESNFWVKDYYPNYKTNHLDKIPEKKGILKRFLEFLLNGKLGDKLDDYFMHITIRHWSEKFKDKYPNKEFELLFRSRKNISKHHPRNFQKIVLDEFNRKMKELRIKHNLKLNDKSVFVEQVRK
jgi:predicted nucleotidyltransferase